MLISTDDFLLFTGTTAPTNFAAVQGLVVAKLESALGIFLESTERAEFFDGTAIHSDGRLYPRATPITSVGDGYYFDSKVIHLGYGPGLGGSMGFPPAHIDGALFMGSSIGSDCIAYWRTVGIEVTYTGGWTPYGSTEGVSLPVDIAEAIAWGIHTKATPQAAPALPRGVASMNIAGEFAVTRTAGATIGADGWEVPARLVAHSDLGGRCLTLVASRRRLG